MATRMCCPRSDASWEHYAAAVLTWATRANAQQTALSIRQCLFIVPISDAWEGHRQPGVLAKEARCPKVGGSWPRMGWHPLMELDGCMKWLCHHLSDLCPQQHKVTPGLSVITNNDTNLALRSLNICTHAHCTYLWKAISTNVMGSSRVYLRRFCAQDKPCQRKKN